MRARLSPRWVLGRTAGWKMGWRGSDTEILIRQTACEVPEGIQR